MRRPVRSVPGLGYLAARQQLVADQSAQFPCRIAASVCVVHIVAECPPAIRFPVIAWMPRFQRVIAEFPSVELSQLYVWQDVPGIGQVSRARGKVSVPRRPPSLVLTLHLLLVMVRVPRIGVLVSRRA